MLKNVASQTVHCQVTNFDGTAKTTGTVTVYVQKDAGSQATGSVGSGAATHKGNGLWIYQPAQAETNADAVTFTFVSNLGETYGRSLEPVPSSSGYQSVHLRSVEGVGLLQAGGTGGQNVGA